MAGRRRFLLLACLLTLGLPAEARRRGFALPGPVPGVAPPALVLRLEGVVASTREAARTAGFDVTSFELMGVSPGRRRWIGVTGARTIGGDQAIDGKDVLALVRPATPNFLVTGPPDLIAALRDAPDGTAVRLEGLVGRGSRTYYLRDVVVGTDDGS